MPFISTIKIGFLTTVNFHLLCLTLFIGTYSLSGYAGGFITYELVETQPHDANSFTQGWVKEGNVFYESSGLYGKSYIQKYSNNISTTRQLSRQYFAEGLTLFNETLYLLTWKEQTLFQINKDTLAIEKSHTYKGEGWGLTHNHQRLIMSNGTAVLLFRDPDDFSVTHQIDIIQANQNYQHMPPIPSNLQLNELEYVNGVIWANNWNDDILYAINSESGCLLARINLVDLRQQTVTPNPSNVLNGIAYDNATDGLWVTGKYWPKRYLIKPQSLSLGTLRTQRGCQP